MLRKLPLNPERRLRVFSPIPRSRGGTHTGSKDCLREALFAEQVCPFTIFLAPLAKSPGGFMKRNRKYIEVIATLLLTTLFSASAIPISEAANKPKAAGRTSNTIPNTILNGKGAPLSSVGINGDFYIDTRSLLIYGPKKSNKWPLPQNLQGPIGAAGADGKNGSEGKTLSTASTVAGPVGTQGEKGDKGEKGEAGSAGASGSAGSAGLTGAKGDTGLTGATGASGGGGGTPGATGAQGPIGNTGSAGAIGAKGETGTAGSVGAIGETGTVGATGPSNVYRGTLSFSDISGGIGTSQTATLSGFGAGSKYIVDIAIVVHQPTRNADTLMPLGLIISNNLGTASIWYNYQTVKGRSYRSGVTSERYEYTILAQVVLDGSSSIDYSLNLQLFVGIDTTTYYAKSDASFTATLVGAVGAL